MCQRGDGAQTVRVAQWIVQAASDYSIILSHQQRRVASRKKDTEADLSPHEQERPKQGWRAHVTASAVHGCVTESNSWD